jgi:hypothetical protein
MDSNISPKPAMRLSVPAISIARETEHKGEAWKLLKRNPFRASSSRLDVRISPPNAPMSE